MFELVDDDYWTAEVHFFRGKLMPGWWCWWWWTIIDGGDDNVDDGDGEHDDSYGDDDDDDLAEDDCSRGYLVAGWRLKENPPIRSYCQASAAPPFRTKIYHTPE